MSAAKRKRKPARAKRELIEGTPPVPHIVTPKPKPSWWERFKRLVGW